MIDDGDGVGIGSLDGIRVLELGHAIAGPHCTQILSDHGADVVKVEPPGGDRSRGASPLSDGESLYFASHNRGKRSIGIDLKHPEGIAVFRDLARAADVIVTNFGESVPRRLGLDYATLSTANPGLIFAHITGFGSGSPYRDVKAYDGVIQAMSGLEWVTGTPEGPPTRVGAYVADHIAATEAALGVLFALIQRQRTGVGGFVDISMLDGYMSTLAHYVGEVLDLSHSPMRGEKFAFALNSLASDGWVHLSPLGSDVFQRMCEVMDAPDWLREADRSWMIGEGQQRCEEEVAAWCATQTRAEIIDKMRAVGVPCGPVSTVEEAVSDPVMAQMGTVTKVSVGQGREVNVPGPPVRFGLASTHRSRRIPQIGEHTRELLQDLGYSEVKVKELIDIGAVEAQ
jgi:crotonobetainyl-CoA:carnitine CoA-transferase CaiB-like acyl-CoA transferase